MDELSLAKLSKYSVLYAEDDRGVQESMVELLEHIFKEVRVASDGEAAYALYQEKHPDLLITDIKMPYMNGIELAKKIRETDSKTKIVMLTAYSDVELMLEVIDLALLCYTVKPITETKLFLAFDKFLKAQDKTVHKKLSSDCYYDSIEKSILFKDKICQLTKKEAKLLDILFANKEGIVTYEAIEEALWGDEYMSHNAMRLMIKNLRKKLPEGVLKNAQGIGYKI